MQQVYKSENNQARKMKHKQGAAMGRCQMRWGRGAFTYQACLFVLQAKGKEQQKMRAKQRIKAVVRKAETNNNNKKLQQSGMQKAQRFLPVLHPKEPATEKG